MNGLIRQTAVFVVTVASGESESEAIPMSGYAMGLVRSELDENYLAFSTAPEQSGTFLPLYRTLADGSGELVTINPPADAQEIWLPDEVAAARWFKLRIVDADGVAQNAGTPITCVVTLKS